VGLKGFIKRLEHAARGNLDSFILEDGSRHYFDPSSGERFLHTCRCLRAGYSGEPYPEPPATIKALCKARDRAAAFEQVCGGTFGWFPYEREALVEREELVPRSMVAPSREDLSE